MLLEKEESGGNTIVDNNFQKIELVYQYGFPLLYIESFWKFLLMILDFLEEINAYI